MSKNASNTIPNTALNPSDRLTSSANRNQPSRGQSKHGQFNHNQPTSSQSTHNQPTRSQSNLSPQLATKLKSLPSAPGVYFHKDVNGEVIYVGKAAVLKNRVRQYFHNTVKDPKTAALVAEIADTDWLVVDTEMDALFLESEMIKRYKPRWNILLRDDKTVNYVRIDMKSPVPYVSFTRTPQDDKATYIGPFYAKLPLEKALRILRKVFPYYDRPYDGKKSLNTDLGLTPGLEIGHSTPEAYKKNLRKLQLYLQGGRHKLLHDLEKQMRDAAAVEDYETAEEAKRQLFALRELQKKIVFSDKEFLDISSDQALADLQKLLGLPEPPRRIEGYDISHHAGTNVVGSMVVFINGVSDRSEYRKFKLRRQQNNDFESLREVLTRRLKHAEWARPDVILLDGGEPQLDAVRDLLTTAGIPFLGRDKSGNHSRNAAVELVVPIVSPDSKPQSAATQLANPQSATAQTASPQVATAQTASPQVAATPQTVAGPQTSASYIHHLLPSDSHLAKLIARIDDEAHRFAITYHTLLARQKMLK